MRLRTILTALGLSSVFALGGCASTSTQTTPATASAPAYVETTQIFGDEVYGVATRTDTGNELVRVTFGTATSDEDALTRPSRFYDAEKLTTGGASPVDFKPMSSSAKVHTSP